MLLASGNFRAIREQRIRRGPIPANEALRFASEIAEALEAAHEKGVIHRDLKPANMKITPEGRIKVLDFGLARSAVDESSNTNLPDSPTLSREATQQGVVRGAIAYVSPEQAKGGAVDRSIGEMNAVFYPWPIQK